MLLVVIFVLQKPFFMLYNAGVYGDVALAEYFKAMWHGLPHDLSLAGYLTAIPGLLMLAGQWTASRVLRFAETIYVGAISLIMSLIYLVDMGLYEYWNTKLDTTPLFYVVSSPVLAAASVPWWFVVLAAFAVIAVAAIYFIVLRNVAGRLRIVPATKLKTRLSRSIEMLLLTGLLFIPIRGGFTVATMNLSAVYHSSELRLNHAAVNPAFSFMYALTHESQFDDQFNYFADQQAHEHFARLMSAEQDSVEVALNNRRPDIYLLILESFSAHLMPSLGGEAIAVGLDSIAREGLLFTNFYASSFRTDRAIPAVLSGYPGQPTTSIMKYVSKAEHLPSIAASLKEAGYSPSYYYGGDANYTNMKAYLISSGFDPIISDRDFSASDRAAKWGVVDHKVFNRCAADHFATAYDSESPRFVVLQTSSSHEPFDVPYYNPKFKNAAANAFAYTDSCLRDFVDRLRATPNWDNTLVVLVPDHFGAYPAHVVNEQRHHVPMVFTGGALARKGRCSTPASQVDLAATLLAQLGIDHSEFKFSKNIFDPSVAKFAEFSNASAVGWITPCDTIIYSIADDKLLVPNGGPESASLNDAKAFLQVLYDDLDKR